MFFAVFALLWACPGWLCASSPAAVNETLRNQWLVYDYEAGLYVPYFPEYHNKPKSLFQILHAATAADSMLVLQAEVPCHVFVNQNLTHSQPESGQIQAKLGRNYFKAGNKVLLMVYSESGFDQAPQVFMTADSLPQSAGVTRDSAPGKTLMASELRPRGYFSSNLIVLGLAILFVFGVFLSRNSPLISFFEFDTFISDFLKGNYSDQKMTLLNLIIFLLYYPLAAAFLILTAGLFEGQSTGAGNAGLEIFSGKFGSELFIIALYVLAFTCLRLLLIRLLVSLYSVSQVADLHFREYAGLSQALATAWVLLGALLLLLQNSGFGMYYAELIAILLIAKSLLVSLRVSKGFPFKKIYLISYFCIAEFVPTIAALKFFTTFS